MLRPKYKHSHVILAQTFITVHVPFELKVNKFINYIRIWVGLLCIMMAADATFAAIIIINDLIVNFIFPESINFSFFSIFPINVYLYYYKHMHM